MDLKVLLLHRHPEYIAQCCYLINEEWKRSEAARIRSLENSCDTLPTNLILLSNDQKVIGHCKLSIVPGIKDACFIETLVVAKKCRGKGFGTYLMKNAEDYCRKKLNLKMIYLSTKDKQRFYEKLGFKHCQPVSIYGSAASKQILRENLYSEVHNYAPQICKGPVPPPLPSINISSPIGKQKNQV